MVFGFSVVQWFAMDKMRESGQLDRMGEQFTHRMKESFSYSHCAEEFEKEKSEGHMTPDVTESEKMAYISECIKNYRPNDAEQKVLRMMDGSHENAP